MILETVLRTILSYIKSSVFQTASQDRSRNQGNVKMETTAAAHDVESVLRINLSYIKFSVENQHLETGPEIKQM